ncbi:hypothetical protein VTL71DRAFT_3225 [Oculimacula yallundae]|uniref:Uncharacterized protein n=1 Tax=Oculimacula yallundae TaxID=86028 RepID=A0ABR4C6L4_9HELO
MGRELPAIVVETFRLGNKIGALDSLYRMGHFELRNGSLCFTTTPSIQQILHEVQIQKFCLIGCSIITLDAVHFYQHFDPYFQIETSIDEAFPRRLGGFFAKRHLRFLSPRFVRIAVFGMEQYSTFTLLGAIPAVIFVILGWIGLVDDSWGRRYNWLSIMGNPISVAQRGLRGFGGCF